MKRKTMRLVVTAVMAALATAVMAMAGVVPVATIALPAIAGLCAVPVVYEFGVRWGFGLFAVVGVLSLFLTADKEAALMYVLFFGHYPVVIALLGRIKNRWLRRLVKLLIYNAAMVTEALLALFVLSIPADAVFVGGAWGAALLLLLANVVLVLYDFTLPGLIFLYEKRLHPAMERLLRLH